MDYSFQCPLHNQWMFEKVNYKIDSLKCQVLVYPCFSSISYWIAMNLVCRTNLLGLQVRIKRKFRFDRRKEKNPKVLYVCVFVCVYVYVCMEVRERNREREREREWEREREREGGGRKRYTFEELLHAKVYSLHTVKVKSGICILYKMPNSIGNMNKLLPLNFTIFFGSHISWCVQHSEISLYRKLHWYHNNIVVKLKNTYNEYFSWFAK